MNEKVLILERNVQSDLAVIERIYSELGEPELAESDEQEALIVVAYRLHGLYSAFENIFRNIATSFENQLDSSNWHRQLLERMRLDLSPIRPAVVDEGAFEKLAEMLCFRHLFLTAYSLRLDALRLQLVVRKALELKPIYRGQIDRFLEFLRRLE